MRTNGIVCYMRNLLSPLQIPIFLFANRIVLKYSNEELNKFV